MTLRDRFPVRPRPGRPFVFSFRRIHHGLLLAAVSDRCENSLRSTHRLAPGVKETVSRVLIMKSVTDGPENSRERKEFHAGALMNSSTAAIFALKNLLEQ